MSDNDGVVLPDGLSPDNFPVYDPSIDFPPHALVQINGAVYFIPCDDPEHNHPPLPV